jgi:cell division septal protein FtsQ
LKPEPVFDKNAVLSILRDFSGKNIFALSTNDIFIALAENIRHIASVEKTLILPDGIRVTITSFPASYRAFIGEEKFLLTENGQLIPDIPEVEAPVLQIYHLVQDSNIGKKTPISDTDMYGIRIILNAWGKYLATIPIDELKFYEQEKEFHIISH